jgi:hypothetical protein
MDYANDTVRAAKPAQKPQAKAENPAYLTHSQGFQLKTAW